MSRSNQRFRGFTMVETVLCTLLVGIVVTGSLAALRNSVRTQLEMNSLIDGPMLAEQLVAEVVSQAYEDPEEPGGAIGTESGELSTQRDTWDDVDDYNGSSQQPPRSRDGTSMTQYAGWTRAVVVTWSDRINGNQWNSYDTGLKRIIVTVTAPDGTETKRIAYRSEWGVLEQPPTVDRTVVTELSGTLRIGTGEAAEWSTNLVNHAEDPNA